jgi:hypothetical protein
MEDHPKYESKNKGGRPLKFQSVNELQISIDKYFEETPDDEWTWTGLAMALDTSRETLQNYKERPEFFDPLKKALLKVENGYEKDLKKKGQTGTIFALKNFGWTDRQEIKHEGLAPPFMANDPLSDGK